MAASYVMKVSGNGQVSIPAEARARWKTDQVVVVDLGDRVVMRPFAADRVDELRGKYADRGPTTSQARKAERAAESARERRRR